MKKSHAYRTIAFIDGSEAEKPLEILEKEGIAAAIDHLSDWDYGEGETSRSQPWGTSDKVVFLRGYYFSYNKPLGYVSLVAPITKAEFFEEFGR